MTRGDLSQFPWNEHSASCYRVKGDAACSIASMHLLAVRAGTSCETCPDDP